MVFPQNPIKARIEASRQQIQSLDLKQLTQHLDGKISHQPAKKIKVECPLFQVYPWQSRELLFELHCLHFCLRPNFNLFFPTQITGTNLTLCATIKALETT